MEWAKLYPILEKYKGIVNINLYENKINMVLEELKNSYGFDNKDAFLILKDIAYGIYLKNSEKKETKK